MPTCALSTSFQQLVPHKIGPLTTHTLRKVLENKIFGFYSTGGPGAGSRLGHKDYTIAPDNIVRLGLYSIRDPGDELSGDELA